MRCTTCCRWILLAGPASCRGPGHHGAAVRAPICLGLFCDVPVQPGQFQLPARRIDSLYVTVTTFNTVGFGDITATSQTARLVVTVQMILDLLVLDWAFACSLGPRNGRDRPDAAVPGTSPTGRGSDPNSR
jgi:Ion channel